jgi:hypothetical protein
VSSFVAALYPRAALRGLWDTSVVELGQRGGIFKKHGIALDILYTQGGGETQQAVISGSAEMMGGSDLFWYVQSGSPIRALADTGGRTIAYSTRQRGDRPAQPRRLLSQGHARPRRHQCRCGRVQISRRAADPGAACGADADSAAVIQHRHSGACVSREPKIRAAVQRARLGWISGSPPMRRPGMMGWTAPDGIISARLVVLIRASKGDRP